MKAKVSEAVGPVLDWMVAKAEGHLVARYNTGEIYLIERPWKDQSRIKWIAAWAPCKAWAQGGPIVERECIGFEWMASEWKAAQNYAGVPYKDAPSMRPIGQRHLCYGPTPLIAAMRCYVTSKIGNEVEVPEELLKQISGTKHENY